MTQVVRMLIANALTAEFRAFEEALQSCPAKRFAERPSYGHTAAWHALHVMDWTRCMIQPGLNGVNPDLTYSFLGFENQPWAQAATGPTLAQEQDGKDVILVAVQNTFAEALAAIRDAPDERFSSDAVWKAINKPRPVLESLMYHVTHTAYHRGQTRQVINQVNSLALRLADPSRPKFGNSWLQTRRRQGSPINISGGPTVEQTIREDRGHLSYRFGKIP